MNIETAKQEYKALRNSKWVSNLLVRAISTLVLATWGRTLPSSLQAPSQALQDCLNSVCNGEIDCVRYPGTPTNGDFLKWSRPYNRAHPVVPAAVVRPRSAHDISGFVKCAASNSVKVQARSGGHSYANYGLGGTDGALSIDLQELRYVTVDENSWHATIGGGSLIGDIDDLLNKKGNRAFSHGVCPGVGIGGQATVGGLGPSSRMWGTALDHVLEVEIVTADGSIVRASEATHEDLFFAVRGAGASFGIVTEFVVKTHEKPRQTIHLTHRTPYAKMEEIVRQFQAWQDLIVDPSLDRRFGTEFALEPEGSKVTATWFGTKKDFEKSGILNRLPSGLALVEASWIDTCRWQFENAQLILADVPTEFYSRSLGLTAHDLLSHDSTESLIKMIKDNKKRSDFRWFVIFDATGGNVSEPAMNSTAFAHRDKVMFYQSYAYNIRFPINTLEKAFLQNIHQAILDNVAPGLHTTYPGYIDPALEEPQKVYWGTNLPRLEQIKSIWDPMDIFHNPQSVRPSGTVEFETRNLSTPEYLSFQRLDSGSPLDFTTDVSHLKSPQVL